MYTFAQERWFGIAAGKQPGVVVFNGHNPIEDTIRS